MKAFRHSEVRADDDKYSFGLSNASSFSVEFGHRVTDGVQLLNGKLSSKLVKPDDLMNVLVKPYPIIVVWSHEY